MKTIKKIELNGLKKVMSPQEMKDVVGGTRYYQCCVYLLMDYYCYWIEDCVDCPMGGFCAW